MATARHDALVDPHTVPRSSLGVAGIEEFADRRLICAVPPDAPVGGGFAG